jgi:ankyrin repeat protein
MSNSETIPNIQSSSQTTEQSLNQIPNVKLSNSDKILIPESKTPTYDEFLTAVKEGDGTEIVKMKLTKEMINKKDVYGRPPLYYAARNGDIGTVRYLVKKEADINLGYPTALFGAAEKGHLHVVMFLTTRGADLNKATGGKTPLGIAKAKGHGLVATHLRSKGAVKTNDPRYNPPGLYAFMGGRRKLRGTKKRRSTRRRSTRRRSTRRS